VTPDQNARVVGTVILCAIGLWIVLSGRAKFTVGGDPDSPTNTRHPIYVNAHGLDAMVIGCVPIALGIINLALAVRGPRRIPVFWTGAGLLIATILYGLWQAVMAVVSLIRQG
jgi:hypothetical protein